MTVVCLYTHCQGLDKMKAETQEPLWKAAAPQTPHGCSRARAGTASLSHHLTHASASKELAQALLLWLGRGNCPPLLKNMVVFEHCSPMAV